MTGCIGVIRICTVLLHYKFQQDYNRYIFHSSHSENLTVRRSCINSFRFILKSQGNTIENQTAHRHALTCLIFGVRVLCETM